MTALASVAVDRSPLQVLFSARPAFGHVYPLIPLALAAQAAGHDVSFATAGAFVPRLQALGFRTFDIGMTLDRGLCRAARRPTRQDAER